MQEEKKKLEDSLKKLEGLKNDTAAYVKELDGQMETLSRELDSINAQINEKETEITEIGEDLEVAKQTEENQYGDMKMRIKYMYEHGQTRFLDMLLQSEDMGQFLNRAEYIREISDYDRTKLREYAENKQKIADHEAKLESDHAELVTLREQNEAKQESVQTLLATKNEELNNYQGQIQTAQGQISQYEQDIKAQEKKIEQIEAEIRRKEEEARKAAEESRRVAEAKRKAEAEAKRQAEEASRKAVEASRKAEEASRQAVEAKKEAEAVKKVIAKPEEEAKPAAGTKQVAQAQTTAPETKKSAELKQAETKSSAKTQTASADSSSNKSSSGGNTKFIWPCPASSKINSKFGKRTAPTKGASTYHQGIDIGASTGTGIVAAASGTVVASTYSYSAGNYIMISHGNGVYTVYMHCSQLLASDGQSVKQGQTIAKVGSSGYSTGPHLHFGVRVNGSYVNPLKYVSP